MVISIDRNILKFTADALACYGAILQDLNDHIGETFNGIEVEEEYYNALDIAILALRNELEGYEYEGEA